MRWALSQRESKQTWSAVSAYRHARGSLSRLFALDVLLAYVLGRWTWHEETADLLVTWALEGEEDPEVLAELLRVLGETEHAEFVTVGLRYAGHPDPRVRAKVPDLLAECGDTPASLTAETRAALFRFDQQPAPVLGVVQEEVTLRRPLGGRMVMRKQLERLLEVGQRRNVEIQVLPTDREDHAGLAGALQLLRGHRGPHRNAADQSTALRPQGHPDPRDPLWHHPSPSSHAP